MGSITIKYGTNTCTVDLGGRSVCDIRAMAADLLNLPDDVQARINTVGCENEDDIVQIGSTVEFVKRGGEKGIA